MTEREVQEQGMMLARIDERTGYIQKDVTEIKEHIKEINGDVKTHTKDIADNEKVVSVIGERLQHHRRLINGILTFIISVVLLGVAAYFKFKI